MSGSPQPTYQTITVEEGYLPAPATKLIITQHLKFSQDPPFWAWIIVGAFYDHEDTVLWSTQVFAGHLDIEVESDEEESDVESEPERASCTSKVLLLTLLLFTVTLHETASGTNQLS